MIEALRELGIVCGKEDSLIKNPFPGKKQEECKVININLKEKNGDYEFNDVILEDFDECNYKKYLYKFKHSVGPNFTPCGLISKRWFKITKETIENLSNKICIKDLNNLIDKEFSKIDLVLFKEII